MSCSKQYSLVFIFFIIVAASLAPRGWCVRAMGERNREHYFKAMFENRLPRGPVPPSDPSPCHNKLGPYQQSQLSYTSDFVICP
ncbi:hypothetical protein RHGRI_026738 [Rhododendron griersonianum]|uniref:Uncharacterized protein n=1 Tax=Rhododendron griersonianum TaxID=479676 RepID=A0AAV6ITZ8_9ERIC|nr:hypothetical protein RHGRI_026738 [Rhododendron griersonianum]